MKPPTHRTGSLAEEAAARYLERRGWRILARNARRKTGEIDLVAIDPDGVLVFVEVRARRSYRGEPGAARAVASVDRRKQSRVIRAAAALLPRWPELAGRPARFDVVAVEPDAAGNPAALRHVAGAFELGGA